jgi:hypothetical protein
MRSAESSFGFRFLGRSLTITAKEQASPVVARLARHPELNPDSAVERKVMSKEQTFRSEDNAFLKTAAVSALHNHVKEMKGRAKHQKRL